MSAAIWIIVAIIVVAILAFVAWMLTQRRRTEHLQDRFGPEYDRAVDQYGDRRKAEPELLQREKRVQRLRIQPLKPEARDRYADEWQQVQAHFVDDPADAVAQADDLVGRVMQDRWYPVGDFEQRAADISVDHPEVVENYRAAHDIAQRSEDGNASTEDLRNAMIHYRSLFEDLLETPEREPTEATS